MPGHPTPCSASLSWRVIPRDRTLALAHSQRLAHLLGVNGFFCGLARAACQDPDAALEVWWSEQRCAAQWGRLVHPDGYGRWREQQARVDFFLEYDRGSEPLGRLAAKLPGYLQLAQASEIATPLLLWLPTPAREAAARQALAGSSLPVATATSHPDQTPAGPLWLPLHTSGRRCRLAQLASAW
jgi:hypothetical protein